jgi:hypothetical protein
MTMTPHEPSGPVAENVDAVSFSFLEIALIIAQHAATDWLGEARSNTLFASVNRAAKIDQLRVCQ